MKNGSFTISLDFELFWGVRDKRSIKDYKKNLEGVWIAIPRILELFKKYDIHASWATVGFLFFNDFKELKNNLPKVLPEYKKTNLSPYKYIQNGKENERKYHFAKELIELIKNTPYQEISSHTFSHFYTMEENLSVDSFEEDTVAFDKKQKEEGLDVCSIVLPRNQMNFKYLETLKKCGITIFRGNPDHWAYQDGDINKDIKTKIFRLIDTFINLSGYKTSLPIEKDGIFNVRSSMFLRPYAIKFSILESVKLRRIKKAMLHAAKKEENFHLWWHPHNFGINLNENLNNLEEILKYYKYLEENYNMKSKNMKELVYE